MANLNATPQQLDKLLNAVSAKLGVPADRLRRDLEQGKFDAALNSMKPTEAAAFNQIVNNPAMLEKFMSTPQAQALYSKLTGGK
ncbi:MAG: transporter substrate-binding domain-containing protein [Prevotella sp.]|nr:transporter substrate-binding domain-containing protein [Prevotella sp.]